MLPTTVTAATGSQTLQTTGISSLQAVDVAKEITLYRRNIDPLMTMLLTLPKETALSDKFQHLETDYMPNKSTCAAGAIAGATSFDVGSGDGVLYKISDIVVVDETGENMLVTGVSTDTLTVTRAYGSVTAAAIPANGTIRRIGSSFIEGADYGTLSGQIPGLVYNYIQDMRTEFGESDISTAVIRYDGDPRVNLQKWKMGEHKMDWERTLWWGQRKYDTATLRHMTGGIFEWATANKVNMSGKPLSYKDLVDWVAGVKPYTQGKMVAFCSTNFLSAVSVLAQGMQRFIGKTTVLGVDVTEISTPHGTVYLKEEQNFDGNTYGYYAVLCDMKQLSFPVMKGPLTGGGDGSTKLTKNIQTNGSTSWIDRYRTVAGLRMKNSNAFSILYNFTY